MDHAGSVSLVSQVGHVGEDASVRSRLSYPTDPIDQTDPTL